MAVILAWLISGFVCIDNESKDQHLWHALAADTENAKTYPSNLKDDVEALVINGVQESMCAWTYATRLTNYETPCAHKVKFKFCMNY